MMAERSKARKLASTAAIVVAVLFLLGIGALALGLHELADATTGTSTRFTKSFMERCIATGQHGDQQSTADGAADNINDLCQCGADNLRADLAEAGVGGFAHILLIEGFDAKMQRVMDECQSTPSAP